MLLMGWCIGLGMVVMRVVLQCSEVQVQAGCRCDYVWCCGHVGLVGSSVVGEMGVLSGHGAVLVRSLCVG